MSIKNSNSLTGANNTGDGQSINIISGGSVNGKSGDVLISTKIADSANMTETGSIEINTGTIDGLLSPLSFTNTGNLLLKTGDNSGAENSTSGFIRLSTGLGGTGIGSGDLNLETGDNEAGTSGEPGRRPTGCRRVPGTEKRTRADHARFSAGGLIAEEGIQNDANISCCPIEHCTAGRGRILRVRLRRTGLGYDREAERPETERADNR